MRRRWEAEKIPEVLNTLTIMESAPRKKIDKKI